MPKNKKYKNETTAEFQARTFPDRIKVVKYETSKVLDPFTRPTPSKSQKAKARKALAAAERVEARLAKPGKAANRQRTPPAKSVSKPSSSGGETRKEASKRRRKPIEDATGTGPKIRDPLDSVAKLADPNRKNK